MNETEKKVESVFGGQGSAADANGAGGNDARIAELERELQRERVESGRLKKANDELATLREEIARLKEQKGVDAAIASVPEDVRNDIAPEVLRASGAMANSAAEGVSARLTKDMERQNEEIRMLREENARRDRNAFVQRLNMQFPGFLDSVADGGAKHDAWVRYQRYNAQTIVNALNSNDFDTIAYHVERFCSELGVPVPSGKGGSATPDPRALAGGKPPEASFSDGKRYSQEEYHALEERAETARANRNFAEYQELTRELDRILAEGRISG